MTHLPTLTLDPMHIAFSFLIIVSLTSNILSGEIAGLSWLCPCFPSFLIHLQRYGCVPNWLNGSQPLGEFKPAVSSQLCSFQLKSECRVSHPSLWRLTSIVSDWMIWYYAFQAAVTSHPTESPWIYRDLGLGPSAHRVKLYMSLFFKFSYIFWETVTHLFCSIFMEHTHTTHWLWGNRNEKDNSFVQEHKNLGEREIDNKNCNK